MSIIRWDPFAEVDTLFARSLLPHFMLEGNGKKVEWAPSTDISETEKEYVIRAELPAVKKEDLNVTFDGGVITIKGERKQHKEAKDEKFHRVESFCGSFERRFSLPDHINADLIRCETKDGVLTVHVPKVETVKSMPKQITVQ